MWVGEWPLSTQLTLTSQSTISAVHVASIRPRQREGVSNRHFETILLFLRPPRTVGFCTCPTGVSTVLEVTISCSSPPLPPHTVCAACVLATHPYLDVASLDRHHSDVLISTGGVYMSADNFYTSRPMRSPRSTVNVCFIPELEVSLSLFARKGCFVVLVEM